MSARWLLLVPLLAACELPTPRDDYDDFVERTAGRRGRTDAGTGSTYYDLRGRWLVNTKLTAPIPLALRVDLSGPDDVPPVELTAKIWLERQNPETDDPLVTTTTVVGDDGTFELRAEPLVLGTDVVRTDSPVVGDLQLVSRTLESDNWCGVVKGSVSSPLNLVLDGSTFSAHRDDDGTLTSENLPRTCVDAPEEEDPETADAGTDAAAVERPASPDLGDLAAERRDITGHWFLNAKLSGISLSLWLSLVYSDGPEGASLDGALRRSGDVPGAAALGTFSTTVDDDALFEVWLPGFALSTDLAEIEADILLVGAILPTALCGGLAGQVRAPLMLDLAGSTFLAVPWTPGTAVPEDLGSTCAEAPE